MDKKSSDNVEVEFSHSKQKSLSLKVKGARILVIIALGMMAAINTVSAEPRYLVYYNSNATPLLAAADADYTHIIISFITLGPLVDDELTLVSPPEMVGQWSDVVKLKEAGKRVMISFGGGDMQADDYRVAIGREVELAKKITEFVKQRGLDGVDIDFEVSSALKIPTPSGAFDGVAFLTALTKALRDLLPQEHYSISHAPQPPYLDPLWNGGGYVKLLKQVGEKIDWIAVQYYNNPSFDTQPSRTVVGEGHTPFVTSYISIVEGRNGLVWPSNKLVVGKPVYKADAANGHLAPASVARTIVEPLHKRYGDQFGGLMGWQFSTLTTDHRYWNNEMSKSLGLKP